MKLKETKKERRRINRERSLDEKLKKERAKVTGVKERRRVKIQEREGETTSMNCKGQGKADIRGRKRGRLTSQIPIDLQRTAFRVAGGGGGTV